MKKVVFLAITLGFLYLATRGVAWERLWSVLTAAQGSYVFAALPLLVTSYLVRALRWKYIFPHRVRSQGLRYIFPMTMIGYFANNILPARAGEIARTILMGRENKISRAGVLSTIVAERTFDGLCVSVIGVLAVQQLHLDGLGWIKQIGFAFAGVFLVLIILALRREPVKKFLTWASAKFPGHLPRILTEKLHSMLDYLEDVTTAVGFLRIVLLSAAIWTLEIGVYALVARSFGFWLHLSQLGIFVATVNFASLVPISPGGVGTIELAATEALVFTGVERETALVMVVTQHALQYLFCLLLGLYYMNRVGLSLRGVQSVLQPDTPLDVQELVAVQARTFPEAARHFQTTVPKDDKYISIVIPAYNEEGRLLPTLLSIVEYFNHTGLSYEVIVVDDGSHDQTARLVWELGKHFSNVKLIRLPRNMGKGAAVRTGILNATGYYIIFNDADGATPILEIERLLSAMEEGADVVIGSRALYSPGTHVERRWGRAVAGRIFAFVVNLWVVPGIADTQCGFKMFRRHAAHRIFEIQKLDRFAFDVEVLRIASLLGYRVVEVPVNWTNIEGSKVSVLRDSFRMIYDVFRVRYVVPNSLGRADFTKHVPKVHTQAGASSTSLE